MKKPKIIITKNAGFCMGVKRAVDKTVEILSKEKKPIYTFGPLIHNPQVIELLSKKGAIAIEDGSIPKEGTVIIRAHGITPKIQKELDKASINIINLTCPFVIKVQKIISDCANKGYYTIIIGDKGHAEVESYLGYSKGNGMVVDVLNRIKSIPSSEKYCVVAQTTQERKVFNKIVSLLKDKLQDNLIVYDTICNATSERQKETVKIAKKTDAMIVIGGKNSANTLRLVDICKKIKKPTFFIEKPNDLDLNRICKYKSIGITAGASTPQSVIKETVEYIESA